MLAQFSCNVIISNVNTIYSCINSPKNICNTIQKYSIAVFHFPYSAFRSVFTGVGFVFYK